MIERTPRTLRTVFLLLTAGLLLVSCGKQKQSSRSRTSASSPWLATVGNDTVTVADFNRRYAVTPHAGKGIDAAEGYVYSLLAERMLADYATQLHLDTLAGPKRLADQLAKEAVVEALLEQAIRQGVTVSDSQVAELYRRSTHMLTLDAWSFPDSVRAGRAYARHEAGLPFPQLDTPNASEGVSYIQGKDLSFNEAAPSFEDAAYSLSTDEVSKPVPADGRWWLLHLDKVRSSSSASDAGLASEADRLRSIAANRQAETVQDAYIRGLMQGRSLDMDPQAFAWLSDYLLHVLPADTGKQETPLLARTNPSLSPGEVPSSDRAMLDRPLVHLKGFTESTWTVGEVLARLATSPRRLTPAPPPIFARRLKREVLFQAEFETLYQTGLREELEDRPDVQREAATWRNNVYAQLGLVALGRRTGTELDVDAPDKLTEARMQAADSLIVHWFEDRADSLGLRINGAELAKLDIDQAPTVVRKTHFPNRPAEPMPVAYRWGLLWAQADSTGE